MSEFDKYQSWISELAPLVGSSEFDAKFKKLSQSLPRSESFQLKMEIKRQAKPCSKTVDLRGKVDGKCHAVDYFGRTHYLDDVAETLMHELLAKFKGLFVETIYDALHNTPNNFRVLRQTEEDQLKQEALQKLTGGHATTAHASQTHKATVAKPSPRYIARFGSFLNYKPRQHERMLYVTKLNIFTEDGQFQAVSVNISSQGLQLKVSVLPSSLKVGCQIDVDFIQLKTEVKLHYKRGISYRVVYHNPGKKDHTFGLKLSPGEQQDVFKSAVDGLILGNKFRYKIDTANVEDAILQRAYEYQTVATSTLLPIYYAYHDNQFELLYTLQNAMTRDIVDFLDIGKSSGLESIFSASRLAPLLLNDDKGLSKECLLLVFKGKVKGEPKCFAAFEHELTGNLAGLFYYFARKQDEFKQYLLQCRSIDSSRHNIPSILHSSISKEIQRRNMPISALYSKKICRINGIMTLTEVSNAHWQRWPKVTGDFNQLKQFQVQPSSTGQLQVIPREFVDKRIDVRYPVKSNVVITIGVDDFDAQSCDISVNGLQVDCRQPVKVKKDEVIQANLVQLQSITKIFKLSRLEYKVVGISHNHTRMHMVVVPNNQGQHVGKLFFKELIKANKDKLKPDDVGEMQEISTGLTNLLIRYQMHAVAFWTTENKRLEPHVLLTNNQKHPLLKFCPVKHHSAIGQYMEIYTILHAQFVHMAQDKLKTKCEKQYIDLILIDEGKGKAKVTLDSQFEDDNAMLTCVVKAIKDKHKVVILRAVASPVLRFNPEAFRLELKYVKLYAPHRADKVTDQLAQLKGLCHLFDVTRLHFLRWKLPVKAH